MSHTPIQLRKMNSEIDSLGTPPSYHTLSLKDLLDARENYHVQLTTLTNVVATALGMFRFREGEDEEPPKNDDSPKTFASTHQSKKSYPCVIVLVKKWEATQNFKGHHATQKVPGLLHLPDGRIIPTCVIKADLDVSLVPPLRKMPGSNGMLGGGLPLIVEAQGQEHVASVGCLVTDGHLIYALTNLHVTGAKPGTPVYSVINGARVEVGKTTNKNLRHIPFEKIHPEWTNIKSTLVTMDVGLIEVTYKEAWTSNIKGIGSVGQLLDLNTQTFSLKLLGLPVKAYGSASGLMRGKIQALFYRYKAEGGKEYVVDFLIGQDETTNNDNSQKRFSLPGDSGTVWHLDVDEHPLATPRTKKMQKKGKDEGYYNMPVAVQWGAHSLRTYSAKSAHCTYALASSLSISLNKLDVELVVDWQSYLYWGNVGHYLIAYKAIDAVQDPNLKKIMSDHVNAITFTDEALSQGTKGVRVQRGEYVPLADVPDLVWKTPDRKSKEGPNHFSDIDSVVEGSTMIDMIKADPSVATDVDKWLEYYKKGQIHPANQGLLQFRVWQLYNLLVGYIKSGDVPSMIGTAGILSHYIGDSCQPLHCSHHYDGEVLSDGSVKGKGVHSKYESQMVSSHSATLMGGIENVISNIPADQLAPGKITGGQQAAQATVDLILRISEKIPPKELINAFDQSGLNGVWKKYGEKTAEVMADGCVTLAQLWDSAWVEGNGNQNVKYDGVIDNETLRQLYTDPTFLPSYNLADIGPALQPQPLS